MQVPLTEEEVVEKHGGREGVFVNGEVDWHRWFLSLSREEKDAYRSFIVKSSLEDVQENKVLWMFYTYDYLSLENSHEELRRIHLRYYNLQQFRGVTSGMDDEFTELFDLDIDEAVYEMFEAYRKVAKSIVERRGL